MVLFLSLSLCFVTGSSLVPPPKDLFVTDCSSFYGFVAREQGFVCYCSTPCSFLSLLVHLLFLLFLFLSSRPKACLSLIHFLFLLSLLVYFLFLLFLFRSQGTRICSLMVNLLFLFVGWSSIWWDLVFPKIRILPFSQKGFVSVFRFRCPSFLTVSPCSLLFSSLFSFLLSFDAIPPVFRQQQANTIRLLVSTQSFLILFGP